MYLLSNWTVATTETLYSTSLEMVIIRFHSTVNKGPTKSVLVNRSNSPQDLLSTCTLLRQPNEAQKLVCAKQQLHSLKGVCLNEFLR